MTNDTAFFEQSDRARYRAILAEASAYLRMFPPQLGKLARAQFAQLAAGEFSRIVALLPHWLGDLIPTPPGAAHRLGVAHLFGWWYYAVQDELLDGDAPPAALLTGHLALLKMVGLYRDLGLTGAPCWADFERLALISAEAYALEMNTRFDSFAGLTPERLAPWTVELIINRAAPFSFNPIAQMYLAGLPPDSPLRADILAALQYFGAARQIADDAADWPDDLRRGRLNFVSARLMARLGQSEPAQTRADLNIERLAGYQLAADPFWLELENIAQSLCRQALERLAPHGDCRLKTLLQQQMARNGTLWAKERARRAGLRAIFGITEP